MHLLLVTFDGHDGCVEYDPKCGVNSHQLASFLLDYLGVHSAMNMDQGGSTTMWIDGESGNGVVSNPGCVELD
jgi:exopolysaccharide biosynthesis protein